MSFNLSKPVTLFAFAKLTETMADMGYRIGLVRYEYEPDGAKKTILTWRPLPDSGRVDSLLECSVSFAQATQTLRARFAAYYGNVRVSGTQVLFTQDLGPEDRRLRLEEAVAYIAATAVHGCVSMAQDEPPY